MDNFREDWQTMPDEDLRDIYRKKQREHKRLGTIAFAPLLPALLVYGFMGWTGFFIFEISGFNKSDMNFAVGRAFYYVGLAVSSALIRTVSYKHRWMIFLPVVISILFVSVLFGEFSIEPVIMLGYLGYAYYRLGKLLPDLDFLRGLPRFPFDYHSAQRDVRNMGMKKAADTLELSSGRAVSTNFEDIFTSDHPELIASPPDKKDDYFQQKKMKYKW